MQVVRRQTVPHRPHLRPDVTRHAAASAEVDDGPDFTEVVAAIGEREKELLSCLARAVECRDVGTDGHVDRVAHHARAIGARLGLSARDLDDLLLAASLHDIGKVALSDAILRKPGPLNDDERRQMQEHTLQGYEILSASDTPVLQKAAQIALSHHERFDGTGYPQGLGGEDIPLWARIVAVADVFDALVSERPYKRAWSVDAATLYLRRHSGTQFDPACVTAFLASLPAATGMRQARAAA